MKDQEGFLNSLKELPMNKLSVRIMKSQYIQEEHLNIIIDGKLLDNILHEHYPDELLLGLVPTIVDWLGTEEEVRLIQSAFFSNEESSIVPVLMCPDDCDLSCTLIVVEVETSSEAVVWKRMGINISNPAEAMKRNRFLQHEIKWLSKIPIMYFSKEDYKSLENIYQNTKK